MQYCSSVTGSNARPPAVNRGDMRFGEQLDLGLKAGREQQWKVKRQDSTTLAPKESLKTSRSKLKSKTEILQGSCNRKSEFDPCHSISALLTYMTTDGLVPSQRTLHTMSELLEVTVPKFFEGLKTPHPRRTTTYSFIGTPPQRPVLNPNQIPRAAKIPETVCEAPSQPFYISRSR